MNVIGEKESEADAFRAAQAAFGEVEVDNLDEEDAEFVEEAYGLLDALIGKYE